MDLPDRIEMDSEGKPQISGKNMPVETVISLLAQGWSKNEILTKYSHLSVDDIRACFKYLAMLLHEKHG